MDDPTQWDEKTLNRLIADAVTEGLMLDYKAVEALLPKTDRIKKEISKDVSSFANSAGGTIVYGIIEKGHLPVSIDGIDPQTVTREWLDQVISSRIQQRIDGVLINQVQLSDGNVVYVVIIPQSERAPHMASDNRYYKRFNFRSVPMEEYEVRDVSNRANGPLIRIKMSVDTELLSFKEGDDLSQPFSISAKIVNDSAMPAKYAVFNFITDSRLQGIPGGFTNKQEIYAALDNSPTLHYLWQRNWGMGKLPIWNGCQFDLFESGYNLRAPKGEGRYIIGWSAKSPNMKNASGIFFLTIDETGVVELQETEHSIEI